MNELKEAALKLKLEAEANLIGLILHPKNPDKYTKSHRLYTFKECSHTQYLLVNQVRRGVVYCKECFNNKLAEQSEVFSITLLGKAENIPENIRANYRSYKFNKCGHIQSLQTAKVRVNAVKCSQCQSDKLEEEAKSCGLKLTDDTPRTNNERVYILPCGHKKSAFISSVRDKQVRCQICLDAKIAREAELAGIKIIGDACETQGKSRQDTAYRQYELACGCNKELQLGHVRSGRFICKEHDPTWYTQPSFVYLYLFEYNGFSFLKLGISKDAATRVKQYKYTGKPKVTLLIELKFDKGYTAFELESELHRKYSEFNIEPSTMRNYLTLSGFTECYDILVQEDLVRELSK